ncbi:sn-glycerol-1-phosphate dehydrogenase [Acuticoccus sp. MNP-M23]|uniref:sn-glycerol-1-phosphate dehydrogenase n=1 Tax=Acuticoccus sp. MNP-M23 TaxID=3072793 RepID=UPI0028151773|nr:sn-glycerol-1-phosphate dehydrogenase [Acuticoccus sp. MNP-M23]WMS43044.1 sn-glycerol-1-phosphate dehydrogenase [Acuticoccus sp. MNP-M23]
MLDKADDLTAAAVARSRAIAEIAVGNGILATLPDLLGRHFSTRAVALVADENTYSAAGKAAEAALTGAGITVRRMVLPASPRPKPTAELGDEIAAFIANGETPVSVGSGVIHDVTKYAAFQRGVPYLCVATAASMDGYSSAGAPLSVAGFKKTIPCRAPLAILADMDIVANAPAAMSGWGYGDLAGKVPAGGDWLVADALGIEPLDDVAWPLVQDNLAGWLSAPAAVKAGDPAAIADLFTGLTLSGLAMEFHGTSRPASGADHQIAHMWEMENLTQDGERVSHGACVSVGCMTALRLYDWLLGQDLTALDAEAIVAAAPSMTDKRAEIASLMSSAIGERAVVETEAKDLGANAHRARLADIAAAWPALSARLSGRMMRAPEMATLLTEAGAPVEAADIGVDTAHLRKTIRAGRFIRSRYTVLDLLEECGLLDAAIDAVAPAR